MKPVGWSHLPWGKETSLVEVSVMDPGTGGVREGIGEKKRHTEKNPNISEDRLWCRNSVCVAVTALLTLLPLPGQYYQNANSNCKQKKSHYDAWSEDVPNHIQAARKKEVFSPTSPWKQTWEGAARSRHAGSSCG